MVDQIRDGVFGFVSGTVTRVFNTKNGPASEIEVKPLDRDGNVPQYGDKWVAWGIELVQGERVSVKGWLSARGELFTNQQSEQKVATRRSINKPEVTAREAGGDSAPTVAQNSDAWATPAAPSVADQWAGNTITPPADAFADPTPF